VLNHPARPVFDARISREAGENVRELAAAWIVAALLLLGTAVSVAFDHMVTLTESAVSAGSGEQVGGSTDDGDGRELHDQAGPFTRRP
jgi:hypothetical protein